MDKKKAIIVVVLGIVLVVGGVIFSRGFSNDSDNKKDEKPEVELTRTEKLTKMINEVFLNKNITTDELSKKAEFKFVNTDVVFGKDGFLRDHLDDSKLKSAGIENYYTEQKKLAEIVEKKFLDNLNYDLNDGADGHVLISSSGFNFALYVSDVDALTYKLLRSNGVTDDLFEKDPEKFKLYEYQGKVVAMKVVNENLDDYLDNEKTEVSILYENGKIMDGQYFNLYVTLTRKNSTLYNNIIMERDNRANKIFNNAVSKGLVDKNNYLKI